MNEQRAVPANVVNIKRAEQQPDASQEGEVLAAPAQRSISCVIPCYNEAANLRELLPVLEEMLPADGAVGGHRGGRRQRRRQPRWSTEEPSSGCRCIRLSRNFGKEAALTAGPAGRTRRCVVLLDGDLQHSPELIPTCSPAGCGRGGGVCGAPRPQ